MYINSWLFLTKFTSFFPFQFVDASKSVEDLHVEIKDLAVSIMSSISHPFTGKLWADKAAYPIPAKSITTNGKCNGDAHSPPKKVFKADSDTNGHIIA